MKKEYKIITALAIAVLLVGGVYYYQNQQKKAGCLTRIDYSGAGNIYNITYIGDIRPETKYFKTHAEAMEWCTKVLFK